MSATASYSVILVFVLVSGVEWCATKELSIAAFNVRIFGQTKAKDEFVMGILTKVCFCLMLKSNTSLRTYMYADSSRLRKCSLLLIHLF